MICPKCGSEDVFKTAKPTVIRRGVYRDLYLCRNCKKAIRLDDRSDAHLQGRPCKEETKQHRRAKTAKVNEERDAKILPLLNQGLSIVQIAIRTDISENRVRARIKAIQERQNNAKAQAIRAYFARQVEQTRDRRTE